LSTLENTIADVFKNSDRRVKEQAAKRAQRRKELLEKNIAGEARIVAWIDILGFSHELQQARTEFQHRAAYHKMLFVHEAFDSPSASDEPEECERINQDYGRTVLALSDGLVVTASPNAKARASMTPYDLLMSFIGDLVMAQANCALNGIFLRGGISIGPFYHENNVLLSLALVLAYKLETERASYPVIIVAQDHIAALRQLKGFKHYAPDFEPSQAYFQPFKSPAQKKGERFYHLDYLQFLAHPDNHGFSSAKERKDSYDSETYSPRERDMLFSLSHYKSAARAMCRHKDKLIEAYNATSSERVRAKYRWLMAYQNRALKGLPWLYDAARIELKRFARN
jgi:hypothetical protein